MLLLCAVVLPGLGLAEGTTTALPNAGFEQVDGKTGVPLAWTPWATGNQCVYTLATAHSGVACALITDDSATISQGLRSERAPITAGARYEASAWVKIAELKAGGFAIYLEYWSGTQRVKDLSVSTSHLGEWAPLKIAGEAPAEATEATVLIYGGSSSVGVAYFDDVALAPVP
jgi:hypothetical protein